MAENKVNRRLAAILAADMVGYSRLMGVDEAGTLTRQKAHRAELIDPKVAEHNGRVVKTTGDGLLAEFPSAVDAVLCAVEIQRSMAGREAELPPESRIVYRIGINQGDVIYDGDDIFGDGVNIAARLEALAEPGGVFISDAVFRNIKGKLDLGFADLGPQRVKNIADPVQAFRVLLDPVAAGTVVDGLSLGDASTRRRWARAPWRLATAMAAVLVLAVAAWQLGLFRFDGEPREARSLSIVVMPFSNTSGNAAQEHFADAITEDLIADLSRIRGAFVISRGTSFTYKDKRISAVDVARQLNVRYVVEGSVRRLGDQVRLNVLLVDGKTGVELWSDKLDRAYRNTFSLQSEITGHIAAVLKVELLEVESRRARSRGPSELRAWDYAIQGQSILYYAAGSNRYRRAMDLFRKALELDPELALAWEGISFIHYVGATRHIAGVSGNHIDLALDAAKKAVLYDPKSSGAHTVLGLAQIWNAQPRLGLSTCQTAVQLNRNNDDAHICEAQALKALGEYRKALSSLDKAARLNPRFRVWRRHMLVGINWAHLGEYDKAFAALNQAKAAAPTHQVVLYYLTAVLAHSGRLAEARRQLAEYLNVSGHRWNTIEKMRKRHSNRTPDLDRILNGLRLAGMPEK